MKLLIISQHFWPESFIINHLAEELVDKKIKVHVLTGKPNYFSGKINKKFKQWSLSKSKYKNIEIIRLPIISRGNKSAIRLILNYISFILSGYLFSMSQLKNKKIDYILVYATSPLLQSLIGVYLKFKLKKKLVIWVQDLWPEVLIDTKYIRNNFILYIINTIIKYIYKKTDLVLAQSDAFKRHLKTKYKIKKILTYENPGIKTFVKLKKKKCKKKTILYTGNIGKAQPFSKIIKIAKKLKDNENIIFKIIGGGSEYNWLKKEIKNQNLEDQIYLESFKDQKRLKKEYELADFLLILLSKGYSLSKTIPNKFQNYLSIGKPILCIGSGEIEKKIVQNKLGIIFDEKRHDIKGFFNDLAKLSHREFIKYYHNNRDFFGNNYKLKNKAKTLIEILKKID